MKKEILVLSLILFVFVAQMIEKMLNTIQHLRS